MNYSRTPQSTVPTIWPKSAISVGLSQRSGEIELYVQDHGLEFNFEADQWQSSGLGLVTTLAKRLKGTFTVERRSGARCTLEIPGPIKYCSLRIGSLSWLQRIDRVVSVTRHWPSKIMRCGDCTTAALANRNGSIGLLRGFARNVRTREVEKFPQAFSDVAVIRTALNLRDFSPA